MMLRIHLPHRYRAVVLWIAGALLCLASYGVLWLVARIEAWSIRQESTASVREPSNVGPALEQALKSLSDAWREENRCRYLTREVSPWIGFYRYSPC